MEQIILPVVVACFAVSCVSRYYKTAYAFCVFLHGTAFDWNAAWYAVYHRLVMYCTFFLHQVAWLHFKVLADRQDIHFMH